MPSASGIAAGRDELYPGVIRARFWYRPLERASLPTILAKPHIESEMRRAGSSPRGDNQRRNTSGPSQVALSGRKREQSGCRLLFKRNITLPPQLKGRKKPEVWTSLQTEEPEQDFLTMAFEKEECWGC
jgi:hypothetical protein